MEISNNPMNTPKPQQAKESKKPENKTKDGSEATGPLFSPDPLVEATFLSVFNLTSRMARRKAKELIEE